MTTSANEPSRSSERRRWPRRREKQNHHQGSHDEKAETQARAKRITITHHHLPVFILSILALSPLILGEADVRYGWLRFSRTGLETGLWMALRAATLTLAFSVSLGSLTVTQMMHLFESIGLRGLGFALGVALNIGPVLRDVIEAAYHTIRLRGGFRRPISNAPLFLVTMIANSLRYGDDVVVAASARGFDPGGPSSQVDPLAGRVDRAFIAGLAAVGAGLLLL